MCTTNINGRREKNKFSNVSACFAQNDSVAVSCQCGKRLGNLQRIRTVRSLANRLRAEWIQCCWSFVFFFFAICCVKPGENRFT